MPKKIKKYEYIRLEDADNGFILRATKVMESNNSEHIYDDNSRMDMELVFKYDEFDQAMEKFKELFMFNMMMKKRDSDSMPESPLKGMTTR